jgi:hypothetical protein
MAYIESVIIRDTGGTEADVTAANALKVDGSAVTQPVNVVAGSISAALDVQQDVFGQLVIANRYNQFEINYDSTDPDSISDITVTKSNGGDASNLAGQAVFTSNANTNGGVRAVTNLTVTYRPNSETYAAFTAIWQAGGLANSYQRIGIYDANNGFFIGYEGVNFGITLRKGGVDTFTAQAAWNVDTLTGGVGSKYTRNGVPEAIDFTKDNLFRIRYGWLGAAPIYWEVLSPDGDWVLFDIYRHPNTTGGTTINNPDLPMTLDIQKTGAGATVLTMNTACWAAGTTSPYTKISSTITDNTLANMSRSVITGRSSTGGGTYYNVKVNPSGSLVTTADFAFPEDSAHASGDTGAFVMAVRNDTNTAMTSTDGDYSPIAVNANGAVAINDGGNSITVDGSVTATVSGSVTVSNGAGAAAVNIQDGGNSITVDGTVTLGPNSGVDIGDVDVTSVIPGTGATNLGKAEDAVHSSGDVGVMFLGVRNDAAASTFAGTNGDYSPVSTDQYGKLFTVSERVHNTPHTASDIGSFMLAVRNDNALLQAATANNTYASISVDEFGKLYGADTKQEDTAHTSGQTGSFILGVRNDLNAAMTSNDGDYSPIAVNASGGVSVDVTANSVGLATEATLLSVESFVNNINKTVKLEDDPSADADAGLFVLAVRNDTNAVVTSTDGDYSQISVNSKGAVAIQDGGNSITVDGTVTLGANSGVDIGDVDVTSVTPGFGTANLGKKEDGPHTSGDVGVFALAVRNDTRAIITSNDGDYSQISVDSQGAVSINDGGNSITVDGTVGVSGTVTVSGTVAATQSGTWILGANSGVDIGDVTINNAGGASAVNIQDGGNSITVDGTVAFSNTTIAVTNTGTFAVQAAQSGTWVLGANSGVDIGDVTVNNAAGAAAVNIQDGGNSITVDGTVAATQSGTWNVVAAGDVAHDSPDSGNPVKIGFQAETALPTAVTNGDRVNGTADQFGRQLVTHISPGMQTWKSGNYTTTQTGVALWTPTAGKTVAVTYLAVSSYATTAGRVIVWFGASGDTTYTAGTDQLVWAGSFAPSANSKPGAILTFNTPVFSANVDYVLRVTTDANISLDVSVYGYEF